MTVFQGIVLPVVLLALCGAVLPRALSRVFPEGVRPLLWLSAVSTLFMVAFGTGLFMVLYRLQGVQVATFFEAGAWRGGWHFLRLGLLSGLAWGPVMVLSIASLPRRWREETW